MSEREHRPTISTMSVHNVLKVSVQRDVKHGCIDIVLTGSQDYLKARISVWSPGDNESPPAVEMLPDAVEEPADAEETDA